MHCPAGLQTELSQISTTLTDALPISDIQTALQNAATGIAAAVTTGQTTVSQVVSKGIQVGRLDSCTPCNFSPAGPRLNICPLPSSVHDLPSHLLPCQPASLFAQPWVTLLLLNLHTTLCPCSP